MGKQRGMKDTMLRIAVTGSPGIGKSTVVAKAAEKLAGQPCFKISGI